MAAMLPPPEGLWGMPPEMLQTSSRLRPRCREEPRRSAQDHGEARLRAGQAARSQGLGAQCRQLSRSGGDPDRSTQGDLYRGVLETIETANWHPKVTRKDYTIGDEQHRQRRRRPRSAVLRELCLRVARNYSAYCNPELDKKFVEQSMNDGPGASARSWSGRSTGGCRRTGRGRSSITCSARPACSPMSRA